MWELGMSFAGKVVEFDTSFLDPQAAPDGARLQELHFSDLYISLDGNDGEHGSLYRIGPNRPGETGLRRVPAVHDPDIEYLRTQISKDSNGSGIIDHGDIRLRYKSAVTADGVRRAAIRRIPMAVPRIGDLGLEPEAQKALKVWGRQRGVVIVGGATGNGKTTTSVAILNEYLSELGEVAVALEDPPEYSLQGWFKDKGYCFQMDIASDQHWEEAVNTVLRWRPRYVFIGEIRSPEAAAQALRASTSGHLVITTAHGGTVPETLGTVLRLAEAEMGEAARKLLSHNLVGVVHQHLKNDALSIGVLTLPRGTVSDEQRKILAGQHDLSKLDQYVKRYGET